MTIIMGFFSDGANPMGYRHEVDETTFQLDSELLKEFIATYQLENAYHCTRLTEEEIQKIKTSGMNLQDLRGLESRIQNAVFLGYLSEEVALKLVLVNQADHPYRKHKIWFTFDLPRLEAEADTSRLFSQWGGEALNISHQNNMEVASALRKIGLPCIIHARIEIKNLELGFIIEFLTKYYLRSRGLEVVIDLFDDYIACPLPEKNIVAIYKMEDLEFQRLTNCRKWKNLLR